MKVEGKVIFITGGANGIGFAVVEKLLTCDAKGVAIIDADEDAGQLALNKISSLYGTNKAIFIKTDVAVKEELQDAFDRTVDYFKQLDIVINNAGIANEQDWEKMLKVNLFAVINGTYFAMKTYLPEYKSGDEGVILNTSSILALQPTQVAPLYGVSKHAIIALGKNLGAEEFYKNYKARVLTICPGFTQTGLHKAPLSITSVFPDKIKEEFQMLKAKTQPFECVAEAFVQVIQKGTNGSVWVSENSESVYEIKIPKKEDFKIKESS